jgi:hypothetical protein
LFEPVNLANSPMEKEATCPGLSTIYWATFRQLSGICLTADNTF